MDQKQKIINKLRKRAEKQTLSSKDAKERLKAAGIPITLENILKLGNAADSHPMSGRMNPNKVDRWINKNSR